MDFRQYLINWLQRVHAISSQAAPEARDIQIRAKCAELRQTLIEGRSDRALVVSLLRSLVPKNLDQWLQLMDHYQVFQGVGVEPQLQQVTRMPRPTAPVQSSGLVRVPQQQTEIQRSAGGAMTMADVGDVLPVLVRGPGILDQLADTDVSLFVSGASNSGKSTLARALALTIHGKNPLAEFYFCEPQDETWLGLERYTSIVRYCTFEELETPSHLLKEAYTTYQERYAKRQSLVRQNAEPPQEHPIWIFINEWNNIFDTWNELTAAERKERDINDMLLHARSIIRAGRKVNVRLVLLGQEHTKQSTGFSTQIKKSMGFVSTGLLLPSGNGGYSSVLGLIKDSYLLEKHQQEVLQQVYQAAVKERLPLLATTLGVPRLAELPHYVKAKSQSIVDSYRYKPLAEFSTRNQPLHLERNIA